MLINVDEHSGKAVVVGEKGSCAVTEALGRMMDEAEGWKLYAGMGHKDEKYNAAAMQEFQHLLMATEDFMQAIMAKASGAEKAELLKLFQVVSANLAK